jgi:hypothetical protein
MTSQQIMLIVELMLRYGPSLARAVQQIFQKQNPTQADWDAVFALADKSYDDYIKPKP